MAKSLFTSRLGGVSSPPYDSFNLATHVGDSPRDVARNREILAELISLPINQIFFMNQVHGNSVAIIDRQSDSSVAPSADALFTSVTGFALVTLIADCTPLLLRSDRAVAAVHVGRKGLMAEVLESTLRVFHKFGIPNNDITGEIGPSICRDCYQVDLETYQDVVAHHPAAATDETRRCLDVAGGLAARLTSAGIEYRASNLCVRHTPGYFSYRRDEVTGRQAGVIWL